MSKNRHSQPVSKRGCHVDRTSYCDSMHSRTSESVASTHHDFHCLVATRSHTVPVHMLFHTSISPTGHWTVKWLRKQYQYFSISG